METAEQNETHSVLSPRRDTRPLTKTSKLLLRYLGSSNFPQDSPGGRVAGVPHQRALAKPADLLGWSCSSRFFFLGEARGSSQGVAQETGWGGQGHKPKRPSRGWWGAREGATPPSSPSSLRRSLLGYFHREPQLTTSVISPALSLQPGPQAGGRISK